MFISNLEVDIARDGVVILADQVFHRGLGLGTSGMGAADRGPARRDFGQTLFCHRNDPTKRGSPRRDEQTPSSRVNGPDCSTWNACRVHPRVLSQLSIIFTRIRPDCHLERRARINRESPTRSTVDREARFKSTPGRTRTCDRRFRKPLLYPPELRAHSRPAQLGPPTDGRKAQLSPRELRPAGFEPAACGLGNRRSIHLSYEREVFLILIFGHQIGSCQPPRKSRVKPA